MKSVLQMHPRNASRSFYNVHFEQNLRFSSDNFPFDSYVYLAGILFASRKTVLKRCLWNKNIIFSFCYANFVDHRDQVSAQMNGKNNLRGGRAGR